MSKENVAQLFIISQNESFQTSNVIISCCNDKDKPRYILALFCFSSNSCHLISQFSGFIVCIQVIQQETGLRRQQGFMGYVCLRSHAKLQISFFSVEKYDFFSSRILWKRKLKMDKCWYLHMCSTLTAQDIAFLQENEFTDKCSKVIENKKTISHDKNVAGSVFWIIKWMFRVILLILISEVNPYVWSQASNRCLFELHTTTNLVGKAKTHKEVQMLMSSFTKMI